MKRTLSGSVDSKQKVLTFGPTGQLGVSHASYRSPDGPLADRMRPRTFEEFIGQDHIFFAGSPMAAIREGRHISSVILWGPPGTGKVLKKSINTQLYHSLIYFFRNRQPSLVS